MEEINLSAFNDEMKSAMCAGYPHSKFIVKDKAKLFTYGILWLGITLGLFFGLFNKIKEEDPNDSSKKRSKYSAGMAFLYSSLSAVAIMVAAIILRIVP